MTKPRLDGKQPNNKKDPDMVSLIKSLFQRGVPAAIIAPLYGVAVSTVYMIGHEHRQSAVPPAPTAKATSDILSKFKKVINHDQGA